MERDCCLCSLLHSARHAALLALLCSGVMEELRARGLICAVLTLVAAILCQARWARAQDDHAYDSIIKPTYRSVFWQVTNTECTAAHSLDSTTGSLIWRRSPVDVEQEWSKQVTDKRVFFTLDSGPSVSAVSLDTGSVKWSWPERAGWGLWRHWATDLPQHTPLAQPLPAITAQLLLLRANDTSSTKVVGVSTVNGSLIWEYDFLTDLTAAAAEGGLQPVQQTTVVGWRLGMRNNLYVYVSTQHAASSRPTTTTAQHPAATKLQPKAPMQGGRSGAALTDPPAPGAGVSVGWVVSVNLAHGTAFWVSGPLEQGVTSVTVSEPVLLVASAPDEAGEAWTYGLDKVTGALLYSLRCGGPCSVQVANTRVGLLTSSITHQQQPALNQLAAFDLVTGNLLWRGLPGSKLAGRVQDDCSLVATPRLYAYFACTCNARAREAGDEQQLQAVGPGVCAFAVETETGSLGYELVLSDADALPSAAARFSLQPLVLPDEIAFSGRRGVYLVPRMGIRSGQDAPLQVPAVRLAWRLPSSNVLNAWDWLDTQWGNLIIHTSPAMPVAAAQNSHAAQDSSDVSMAEFESEDISSSSSSSGASKPQTGFLVKRHSQRPKPKPAQPQTWVYALDISNGTLSWSQALDMSVGPLHNHALSHNWGRQGSLLLDSCRPPLDDVLQPSDGQGLQRIASWVRWPSWLRVRSEPDEESGSGTSCCLTAVSAKDGSMQWQHCFDMDHACSLGLTRSTATNIVYVLLGVQALVLCLGCIVGIVWGRRASQMPQASIMQDPDSEDEALLVQVLPPAAGFGHHYTEHQKPLLSVSEQQAAG